MQETFRRRKKRSISLIFSAIILATIPIAIYSLLNYQDFDLRNLAIENKSSNMNCTINIPYVNARTLAKDKIYQIHVYANLRNESAQKIEIFDKDEKIIFSKNFDNNTTNISEVFTFSPTRLGEQEIWGKIQTAENTYLCAMVNSQEKIFVLEKNHPPEFLTDPYFSAKPPSSSLSLNENYEYVLEVADRDRDIIEYHYSFTPRADWLNKTVLENGKDGKLKIKFVGTPDKEGSYLANIFVHDGYNKHISAQTWTISIGQESTNIPVVSEPRYPSPDYVVDNEIIFEEPQITKVFPRENSFTKNQKEVISANLIASNNATIEQKSIIIKINNEDITEDTEIIKISSREILIRYTPQSNLKFGEHKVYIFFKDSNELTAEKEWSFVLDKEGQEKTFLGYPINTVVIFVMGILLVLFAISIPWMIYIAWKKDEIEDYEELPIIKSEGQSSFQATFPSSFKASSNTQENKKENS